MKRITTTALGITFLLGCLVPSVAIAHQPRVVEKDTDIVEIQHPDISQAFYGTLEGKPQLFQFSVENELPFYMNVLVPTTTEGKRDVSATLYDTAYPTKPLATIGGESGTWTIFHEEFGRDDYYKGSEFRATLTKGTYAVRVESTKNDSLYTLAVGEKESFPVSEILKSFVTLPEIKSFYFGKPFYAAFATPFLAGPLFITIAVLALILYGWSHLRKTRRK